MNSSKVLSLSACLTLAATLLVTASASAATSTQALSNQATVSQGSVLFSANTLTGIEVAREKEPKDDHGKDRDKHGKDRDSKGHKVMASGGSKPCQLYYGCVPAPTPAPKGGGKDNPKGHKFAPAASEFLVAREREPRDDRGRDKKDHDKNDDHGRHGSGHKFVSTTSV